MARIYEAIEGVLLPLGRRGENEALEVRVNIKQWIADYGNGSFGGLAQRYSEDEPYPVTITVDGEFACWLVTDVDTAIEGYGKFELDYIVGGVLAKSVVWRTKVQPSVAEPGPVPDPYESWVEEVLEAGSAVLGAIPKVVGANAGNIPALTADGAIADSGIVASQIKQTYPGVINALAYPGASIPATVETDIVYTDQYKNGNALENYNTYDFPVIAGETYHLTVKIPPGIYYRPGLFYSPGDEYVGQLPRDGETYNDYIFTVPSGATLLRVSASALGSAPVLNGNGVYPDNIPNKFRTVEVLADGAIIRMDNYSVTMQKHGNNNLLDIYKIYKSDGTLIYTSGSDWQGPYTVDAINNADGDAISEGRDFTGGNHSYAGTTGTATGKTLSISVYADGKLVTSGNSCDWLDCVTVEWENEIQAWNTKKSDGSGRSVLHEKPRWTFHRDGTIEVQNTIIATEDILIYNYYGIQMQATWLSNGFFLPSVSRKFETISDLNTLCGGFADGVSTIGYNTNIAICMGFDPLSDLGSGVGLGDWVAKRIHTSSTKIYTRMCDKMRLSQGNSASYRGYYKLVLPDNIEGFASIDTNTKIAESLIVQDEDDSTYHAVSMLIRDGHLVISSKD